MTFEEACSAAELLLDQRGTLINSHLLRLVGGDKGQFRRVREFLIREGKAEDRAGVGLALAEGGATKLSQSQFNAPVPAESMEETDDDSESVSGVDVKPLETEWWIMSSGVTSGPFEFATICRKRLRGEIVPGDVIRKGAKGLWQQPGDIPSLAVLKPQTRQLPVEETRESVKEIFVPPPKAWTTGNKANLSWLSGSWDTLAGLVGGSRRLAGFLTLVVIIVTFEVWWYQPPPTETIVKDFNSCFLALQKLRERRVGRSEWAPTVDQYRPRVRSILDRLKFRSGEIERELYVAGSEGLLPLLNIPTDPTNSELIFEQHMEAVKRQLEKRQTTTSAADRSTR